MAMNREQKRMLQRQGEVDADGEPIRQKRGTPTRQAQAQVKESAPLQPPGHARGPQRAAQGRLAHPHRDEATTRSSCSSTLVLMTTFIFGVDWVFSQVVLKLFNA